MLFLATETQTPRRFFWKGSSITYYILFCFTTKMQRPYLQQTWRWLICFFRRPALGTTSDNRILSARSDW